ncbi:peptidase M20 domain-containing protein 2 [Trichonephila inaurata madagascariensis]|uniref:Peptidase M20 domain-containing protein 2 n=1 Tax=Trichonephila inaurata madagascariensis TaxID=2747483 RepID=A0A8X7CHU2_9ARAC|nr:peptidase M20 domain-containing protein 2 [Trichonephila inaurata madagascariensis]
MAENDFEFVCSKIDEKKEFLNSISQEIWKRPELKFKEVQAHALLTSALKHSGFQVREHYFMPTAFRAEYCSQKDVGPTIAILLEYDALPEIGHACGHNLISEAGLGAAMAVKAAMKEDNTLLGKLVVMGTPAEEGGGGKILLLELGAFEGIDAAMMVHPTKYTHLYPNTLCNTRYSVTFKGKESHALMSWEGLNSLDAAVTCYMSISQLRQHIKSTSKIQAIIGKGGTAANVVPSLSTMDVHLRTSTKGEQEKLRTRVEACFLGAAMATGCDVEFKNDKASSYENLLTNRTLANIFEKYALKLGMDTDPGEAKNIYIGSTDMGNVSRVVPSLQPLYAIPTDATNHSKMFAEVAGSEPAQKPTLDVSKAMAMTVVEVMRSREILKEIKKNFKEDLSEDL